MTKLNYFSQSSLSGEFAENQDGTITKKALVLIEGQQTDSNQRSHVFSPDRLEQIATKTNSYLNKGHRLPLIKDHNKVQEAVIGDVTGDFFTKVIEAEDLHNRRLKHLIGKVGLFTNEVVVKSKKAIEQCKEGLLNTISAGLNLVTDEIREVSAVPLPAILGCAMFKSSMNNKNASFALSMDEAEQEEQGMNEARQELDDVTDRFWNVILSVYQADEDDLEGNDPKELLGQAISDYSNRIASLIGLDEEEEQMSEQQLLQQQPQQGQMQQMRPQMGSYSNTDVQAAFSLSDMAKIHQASFADYSWRRRDPSLMDRAGSIAGNTVKIAGTTALAGGGLYATRLGIAGGSSLLAGKGFRRGGLKALSRDLRRTSKVVRNVGSGISSPRLAGLPKAAGSLGGRLSQAARSVGKYAGKFK